MNVNIKLQTHGSKNIDIMSEDKLTDEPTWSHILINDKT